MNTENMSDVQRFMHFWFNADNICQRCVTRGVVCSDKQCPGKPIQEANLAALNRSNAE